VSVLEKVGKPLLNYSLFAVSEIANLNEGVVFISQDSVSLALLKMEQTRHKWEFIIYAGKYHFPVLKSYHHDELY